MQFSLQIVAQRLTETFIASCRRYVTCCNLELQLARDMKKSVQSLQKVESSCILCNRYKPKKVARQVAKRACYTLQPTCNFSRDAIAAQVVKKIMPCNTSCKARYCCLQRLQIFFETIANCSLRLQRVTMSPATWNGFLFPMSREKLQRKLHRVTLALLLFDLVIWRNYFQGQYYDQSFPLLNQRKQQQVLPSS